MAASVGPDGGQYIGPQVLIDRFLGSRHCRVKVPLPSGPDQRGGAAGTLDGVLVGQKAYIGATTLAASTMRRAPTRLRAVVTQTDDERVTPERTVTV